MTMDGLGGLYVADQAARRVRLVIDSKDNCFIDGQCYIAGVYNPVSACQFCDAGKGPDCDDGNKCTADACDDKTGLCVSKPIAGCS